MTKSNIYTLGLSILTASLLLLLTSCAKENCCYRITKANLTGNWVVDQLTVDGENEEAGNSTFEFGKDNDFKHTSDEGTWEFGDTRNVIKIATDTKAYDLEINVFEENNMTLSKDLDGKIAEYRLVRQ